tara:strand:- start:195 stop:632 length:438 start_codon:yes stop_codon:yes gene_type:complete
MAKVKRIFDIAKELNISHLEIIEFLKTIDENTNFTIMTSISNEIYAQILDNFYQDASAVDRLRKEKARLNVIHPNQDLIDVKNKEEKSAQPNDQKDKVEIEESKPKEKTKKLDTAPKLKIIKRASESESKDLIKNQSEQKAKKIS